MSRLALIMALVGVVSLLALDAVTYERVMREYEAHEKWITYATQKKLFAYKPIVRLEYPKEEL